MVFNQKAKSVYISYIPEDTFYAETVANYLKEAGYAVALSPHLKRGSNTICKAMIQQADAVVLLTSPAASRSSRFWRDTGFARVNDKPVIPMVVHEFFDDVPKKYYIKATDDILKGCDRLAHALTRANGYRDNALGERERPQVVRAIRTAAVVAATALFGLFVSS